MMHYYQFNIGDYIKQTVHLTPMEDVCYRRLLDMYYETEQPIPTETNLVSRRLRLDTELVNSVLKEFFSLTENGWVNARCDAEISAYHLKTSIARSNGKLGGRPKKTQSVILANPELTQTKPDRKLNKKQETINIHTPTKADVFVFKAELLTLGADPVLAADWLAVRKTKRASNTKTALDAFVLEAGKAGYTLDQALRICCEKSWQGFKADWVKDIKPAESSKPTMTREEYDAKKKADMAIARAAYLRQEAAATVPVVRVTP